MTAKIREFLRFFISSGIGVCVDLFVISILISAGHDVQNAAIAGFFSAVLVTYFCHVHWTFSKHTGRKTSFKSSLGYVLTSAITLAARLGIISFIETNFMLSTNFSKIFTAMFAIGVSFVMNYLFSKFFVFNSNKKV